MRVPRRGERHVKGRTDGIETRRASTFLEEICEEEANGALSVHWTQDELVPCADRAAVKYIDERPENRMLRAALHDDPDVIGSDLIAFFFAGAEKLQRIDGPRGRATPFSNEEGRETDEPLAV